ncbi:HAD family hydrolase [Rhizobiales bacterium]|uniref:HAD family hydrolase n=1 Tax=Hongsoonwoonella zoysiae TaxID=2821844 RepID=UPI001561710D|nr:HAD family hydrolase [Hongsoonwoonella zoysiae]NRG18933.1 HAD family hydrolase [Hongsoonwoonella zoysiae]
MAITTIGFDADDTLWHNERFFKLTEERFATLLSDFTAKEHLRDRLLAAEKRNIRHYGFGVKGFTLSMVETAIEVTGGAVPAKIIGDILEAGREMLSHPVETLPHAQETLEALHGAFRLVLITKGDLFDQERKLAQSGLDRYFDAVEIVSDKQAETYERIFRSHGDGPERAAMVGNSLKSDVLPALRAGSHGVHVPHDLTWALEHAEEPQNDPRFHRIANLSELPLILDRLRPAK